MSHTTPPTIDGFAIVQLQTPRGLTIELSADQVPEPVRKRLNHADDIQAAITMARLTGLDATVKRTTQTTVRAADIEETQK